MATPHAEKRSKGGSPRVRLRMRNHMHAAILHVATYVRIHNK